MAIRTSLYGLALRVALTGAAFAPAFAQDGMNYRGACDGRASVLFASPRAAEGPVYPPAARTRREQGDTVLRIAVGQGGAAAKVEVTVSSGSPRLDNSALAWARRRWRGASDCRPGATTQLTIAWRLTPPKPDLGHQIP